MTTPVFCLCSCVCIMLSAFMYLREDLVESGCVFYRVWVGGRIHPVSLPTKIFQNFDTLIEELQ